MKKARPIIISFAAIKGGGGKTTLAANIAYGLAMRKYKVLALDADAQEQLYDALEQDSNGNTCLPVKMSSLPDSFDSLRRSAYEENISVDSYNFIIIDTPGKIDKQLNSAIKISDLVLIPVHPASNDLRSLRWTMQLINQGKKVHNKLLKVAFVINRVKSNTKVSKAIVDPLRTYDHPILETKIHDSTLYNSGAPVLENPKSKAAIEINFLIDEIIKDYVGDEAYV